MLYATLFVVAIIGFLSLWYINPGAFTSFSDYVSTTSDNLTSSDSAAMKSVSLTRDIARSSHLNELQSILTEYRIEKGLYPQTLSDLEPDFILSMPVDPKTNNAYEYESTNEGQSYKLCIAFESPDRRTDPCITPD